MSEIMNRVQADHAMNIWITPPDGSNLEPYLIGLEVMNPEDFPLWGIPFAVKDNIDVKGLRTTAACPDYSYLPEDHATVVQRLVDAGAIPIGKCNLDQFATGLVGTRSPYGETHNALRSELISGGSSSGSSVAVARGHVAFALGTDTAGSGRVPAALNRLVGFKPSLGAWPTRGVVPACASLDCVTAFAHNVEDTLTVDAVIRGVDEQDPWSRTTTKLIPGLPGQLCLPKGPLHFFGPYADVYRKAWNSTLHRIESLGLPITYVDMGLFTEAAKILYGGPWVAERWCDLGSFVEQHPKSTLPVTETVLRTGAADGLHATSLFSAIHKLQGFKLEVRKLLANAVLILPTCGGTWTREQVRDNPMDTNTEMGYYTNHCNLLDLCAVSVPGDDAGADLPFGITLFGLSQREGFVANVSALLTEEAIPTPSNQQIQIAVCGLHMQGYPLEKQMLHHKARFSRAARTAAKYSFVKLPTSPAKPGLIRLVQGGNSISVEIWEMPIVEFGRFASVIPAPLGIGKVELEDGTEVSGFICESYAAFNAEDITALGGWRNL